MKRIILILACVFSGHVYGLNVSPASSVLGVPWGSTEEETIKVLGVPNGHFQTTKHKKLLFYGKSIVLLYTRGRLKGFRYYEACCRILHTMAVSINQQYSNVPLTLDGVELKGKPFQELSKSLPYDLGISDYRSEVATDEVTMKFGFSSKGYPGQTQEFYFSNLEIDYEL